MADDGRRRESRGRRCRSCRGTGRVPGIVKTTGMGKGMGSSFGPCPDCDGTGRQPTDPE